MNQPLEVIGSKNGNPIHELSIEIARDTGFLRAVMNNKEGDFNNATFIVDIAEARNAEDLIAYLHSEIGISQKIARDAVAWRLSYDQRFIATDQWNEQQSKLAGLMNQFEAGTVIYSLITHAPYRVASPSKPTEERPGYVELVRQRIGVEDPDECFIASEQYDTVQEATFAARNHIERDLFIVFTGK